MERTERLAIDGYGPDVEPVLFYDARDEWGVFSNFSRHPVVMPHPFTGKTVGYLTAEHRFQAMKATNREAHDYVAAAAGPGDSKHKGREILLRDGWGGNYGDLCWYVMFEVVLAKAFQHDEMMDALMLTGTRPIYEDSPVDDIWGWRFRNDYRGKNLLGRVLMQVRDVVL